MTALDDPFVVFSSERGVVRIYTTDLDAEGSSAITPANVERLLGDNLDLDASRVEVFPSTVLEAMGLSTYLREGYGIPKADLDGQAASLDAMKGLVIVVSSAAFQGRAVTIEPKSAIRFVGAFSEPDAKPPELMAGPKAAEGQLTPQVAPSPAQQTPGRVWPFALLALILATALVLFVLL